MISRQELSSKLHDTLDKFVEKLQLAAAGEIDFY